MTAPSSRVFPRAQPFHPRGVEHRFQPHPDPRSGLKQPRPNRRNDLQHIFDVDGGDWPRSERLAAGRSQAHLPLPCVLRLVPLRATPFQEHCDIGGESCIRSCPSGFGGSQNLQRITCILKRATMRRSLLAGGCEGQAAVMRVAIAPNRYFNLPPTRLPGGGVNDLRLVQDAPSSIA